MKLDLFKSDLTLGKNTFSKKQKQFFSLDRRNFKNIIQCLFLGTRKNISIDVLLYAVYGRAIHMSEKIIVFIFIQPLL